MDFERQLLISRLLIIRFELEMFLAKGRAMLHNGMKQVGPGVWINEKFNSVEECLRSIGEVPGD